MSVVLVHPIGGDCRCYYNVARDITGGERIIGINHPDVHKDKPASYRSVHQMALEYCTQTLRKLEHKPKIIVGWSFGGIVAHAMIKHWQERDVAPVLVMLDSPLPESEYVLGAKSLATPIINTDNDHNITRIAKSNVFRKILDEEYGIGLIRGQLNSIEQLNIDSVHAAGMLALAKYDFSAIDAPIHYILPTKSLNAASTMEAQIRLQQITNNEVVVHLITGDHFSLIQGKSASECAGIISKLTTTGRNSA